jgi:hypothetical protein
MAPGCTVSIHATVGSPHSASEGCCEALDVTIGPLPTCTHAHPAIARKTLAAEAQPIDDLIARDLFIMMITPSSA